MTTPTSPALDSLGKRLRAAMAAVGAKNQRVADVAGVHVKTVSYWLNDKQVPDAAPLDAIAADLGVTSAWLRYGGGDVSYRVVAEAPPGYASRPKLRPAPYARVFGYLEKMREAGMPPDAIDEAERYLVDSNFGQLNKRDYRERTDEDVIGDIDMMWAALKHRFERDFGVRL